MTRHTSILALCLALGLAASAQAQFSFRIGVGTGGYYGPGHYGRGYYPGFYGPGFYGPGFYGPGYGRSGVSVRISNFGYYDDPFYPRRGYYPSRPQVNYYVLPDNSVQTTPSAELPSNRVAPTRTTLNEGDILLRSPQDAPAAVGYGINDKWVYTMKAGEKQKLEAGREWTIEFHRGIDGAASARYALDPGIYEFTYSEVEGWDLARVDDELPAPPEPPPAGEEVPPAAGSAKPNSNADDFGLPPEPPPEEGCG